MNTPGLVVFDCNIFLQAILSKVGPAHGCFEKVRAGELSLVVSPFVLAEVRRMPDHPGLRRFRRLTSAVVDRFLVEFLAKSRIENEVPAVFTHPRDPDDAHYVNLALKCGATLIVSRDRDLLDLAIRSRPEGLDFGRRFPNLRIVGPADLLAELAHKQHGTS